MWWWLKIKANQINHHSSNHPHCCNPSQCQPGSSRGSILYQSECMCMWLAIQKSARIWSRGCLWRHMLTHSMKRVTPRSKAHHWCQHSKQSRTHYQHFHWHLVDKFPEHSKKLPANNLSWEKYNMEWQLINFHAYDSLRQAFKVLNHLPSRHRESQSDKAESSILSQFGCKCM